MSTLALIPARGGSKGIPRKNIRLFCGKPLLQWSVEVALASQGIDQVIVSTDDPTIALVAKSAGAEVPFMRPAEFATDSASGISTVIHALEQLPQVSDVLLLQPTSPLRSVSDIESIISLRKYTGSNSAVSVTLSSKHPSWMYTFNSSALLDPIIQQKPPSCRQQLVPAYVLNGSLYLANRAFLLSERSFVSRETVGYVMPPERSVDIDTPLDWQWAEFLMSHTIHE